LIALLGEKLQGATSRSSCDNLKAQVSSIDIENPLAALDTDEGLLLASGTIICEVLFLASRNPYLGITVPKKVFCTLKKFQVSETTIFHSNLIKTRAPVQ
jgi:hypothetical protein